MKQSGNMDRLFSAWLKWPVLDESNKKEFVDYEYT